MKSPGMNTTSGGIIFNGRKEGWKKYPANLLDMLHLNELCESNMDYGNLMKDQLKGVEYILSCMPESERIILRLYYCKCMSRKAIAEEHHLCEERIRQITEEALKRLPVKVYCLLKRVNIQTIRELLISTGSSQHISNLGDVSIANIKKITKIGL